MDLALPQIKFLSVTDSSQLEKQGAGRRRADNCNPLVNLSGWSVDQIIPQGIHQYTSANLTQHAEEVKVKSLL